MITFMTEGSSSSTMTSYVTTQTSRKLFYVFVPLYLCSGDNNSPTTQPPHTHTHLLVRFEKTKIFAGLGFWCTVHCTPHSDCEELPFSSPPPSAHFFSTLKPPRPPHHAPFPRCPALFPHSRTMRSVFSPYSVPRFDLFVPSSAPPCFVLRLRDWLMKFTV